MRNWIDLCEEKRPSFKAHRAELTRTGVLTLYRVMNLSQNPVTMIENGHNELGCFWSYDLEFLRHGDYDFGYGGTPESWFYFNIEASPDIVDWESTSYFYRHLNDFEKEVRLHEYKPIKLLGISDHFGNELDCSSILGKSLTTGRNPEVD